MLTLFFFFFFNDTATTEIYTLSLHDALPIYQRDHGSAELLGQAHQPQRLAVALRVRHPKVAVQVDRKSTRLNSSHSQISYAVFCLKKKKNNEASPAQRATRYLTHRMAYQYRL